MTEITQEQCYDACVEEWRKEGCPVIGDMSSIILEHYNNAVYDRFHKEDEDEHH